MKVLWRQQIRPKDIIEQSDLPVLGHGSVVPPCGVLSISPQLARLQEARLFPISDYGSHSSYGPKTRLRVVPFRILV